jgi:hypothetical protein
MTINHTLPLDHTIRRRVKMRLAGAVLVSCSFVGSELNLGRVGVRPKRQ